MMLTEFFGCDTNLPVSMVITLTLSLSWCAGKDGRFFESNDEFLGGFSAILNWALEILWKLGCLERMGSEIDSDEMEEVMDVFVFGFFWNSRDILPIDLFFDLSISTSLISPLKK